MQLKASRQRINKQLQPQCDDFGASVRFMIYATLSYSKLFSPLIFLLIHTADEIILLDWILCGVGMSALFLQIQAVSLLWLVVVRASGK